MSNVIELARCTSCGACLVACPVAAITMDEDIDGFAHAHIDDDACIHCGRCVKTCPSHNPPELRTQEAVYAAQSPSREVLATSASGGAFFELAHAYLREGGVVYGAAMNIDHSCAHIEHKPARSEADLAPLQGSKYALGTAYPIFAEVERALQNGEHVLFSGLPCQVAGLYGYLGCDYDTLVTVDLFCHGNTSERYLNLYLSYVRDRYHGEIEGYVFRDKAHGVGYNPRISFTDGRVLRTTAMQNAYWYLFQNSKFYRLSCHSCPYATDRRVGDLSIGDFWGIERQRPELLSAKGGPLDETRGISVVLANTPKGDALLQTTSLVRAEASIDDVIPGGAAVRAPQPMPADRDTILALFRAGDYAAIKRYCIRQMGLPAYLIDRIWDTPPIRLLRRALGR